jgi:hypothetical protein
MIGVSRRGDNYELCVLRQSIDECYRSCLASAANWSAPHVHRVALVSLKRFLDHRNRFIDPTL